MASGSSDERRLVRRMCAGDEEAFDHFATTYVPGLYRFAATRLTRELDLVPDLVQTALAKAIDRLDGFRGDSPLFTWLCACLKNEIASHFRRAGRRPVEVELDAAATAGAVVAAIAEAPEAEDRLLRLESAELVHAALDALPERYARALEWKYLEGASVAEIAARLDVSEKAAESLLGRARAAFRDAYMHLDEPPAAAFAAAAPAGAETAS
jgi:RNA polymerase sigma-70 factor (ECF subfamily)